MQRLWSADESSAKQMVECRRFVGAPYLLLLTLMFGISGCVSVPKEWSTRKYEGPFSWPPRNYAKVVGYSFKNSDWKGVLSKTGVRMEELSKRTLAKATLSTSQTSQLLGACLKPKTEFPVMLCYFPRHIFVFFSDNDVPMAAIEVCFACNSIRSWPSTPYHFGWDFSTLARLSDELGFGLGSDEWTLQNYLKRLAIDQAKCAKWDAKNQKELLRRKAKKP